MKYAAGVIAIIVAAFLAIIVIVHKGGSNTDQPRTQGSAKLATYAQKDSEISVITQGHIVGDDAFRSIRITVTPTERRVDVLSGYNDEVIKTQTYQNTATAYETFLESLDRAGFRKTQKSSYASYKGVCPLGNRFLYTLKSEGNTVVDTWSTSCQSVKGTFLGNGPLIRSLFQKQITDYGKQVSGVNLSL